MTEPRWLIEAKKTIAASQPFKVGSTVHLLEMAVAAYTKQPALSALTAILARINGEFDHPALASFGPLSWLEDDVKAIAENGIAEATATVSVDELVTALRKHPVAQCVIRPEHVLTAYQETGDSDEQHAERLAKTTLWLVKNRKHIEHAERLAKATLWLVKNRKHIEEAMTQAGFAAIENSMSTHELELD